MSSYVVAYTYMSQGGAVSFALLAAALQQS